MYLTKRKVPQCGQNVADGLARTREPSCEDAGGLVLAAAMR